MSKPVTLSLLFLFLPLSVEAQVIDERMRAELEAQLAAQRLLVGPPPEAIDEEKFDDAVERREKRKEEALEQRREINANKNHVYSLARMVVVPGTVGPFDLARDINRGGGVVVGGGGAAAVVDRPVVRLRRTLKVLFLQDASTVSSKTPPTFLAQNGLGVLTPDLPLTDVAASVLAAEFTAEKFRPDVIVGHSKGAAVAMNMDSGGVPLVLLGPDWQNWGTATQATRNTTILHSPTDNLVPFASSELLRQNSGLPATALVQTGIDHQLADSDSLNMLLRICLRVGT